MWAVVDYYSQWLSRIQLHRSADEETQIAEIYQKACISTGDKIKY